ncbi:MAG: hypothetical protein A2521_15205 [Deltaproteobacteria bacterium RIFOXYD12_FULL_57_12]|nr:MAG: hypothetical protein A2521_15205 [Deltaproteobacteria bacterium RIFOXYD12_FULL_57_12]
MKKETTPACDQKRRSFLKLCGLLGLGTAAAATLPVEHAEAVLFGNREYKVSKTRLAMGSFLAITAVHSSQDEAENAIGLAFEEVDRLSRLLSRHDHATPVFHLNSTGQLPQGEKEVLEVIARSLYYFRQTGGAFDITVKPLLDLYQGRFSAGQTPSDADINDLLPRIGSSHLQFSANQILFGREGMGITLDGIAPGYIVDRVSELLCRNGVVNHLINASGDIRVSGLVAKGKPWTVAIQDPAKHRDYPKVVTMQSGAISTSGDYEVFYDREKMFHHIVDGRTGHSPVWATSVTAMAPTVMDADALSTSLFVMPPADGIRLINSQPGCGCFLIGRDGKTMHSTGWPAVG